MRRLLIVIDLQKGWRHKIATEEAMLKTVELCKGFSGDIIHCRFKNDPNSLFHTQLHWTRFVEAEDTDEIPEIVDLHLPTYWRTTYSCANDQLRPLLKQYDQVYLAGVFTDISVFVTALDIFDMNIPVSVVMDCIATLHGEPVHHYSLRSLGHAIGNKFLIQSKVLVAAS
jgi:nicotinamidase-related amidase